MFLRRFDDFPSEFLVFPSSSSRARGGEIWKSDLKRATSGRALYPLLPHGGVHHRFVWVSLNWKFEDGQVRAKAGRSTRTSRNMAQAMDNTGEYLIISSDVC